MRPSRPSSSITALAIRTRVIGAGNSFEVLIPLSEIDPTGQNYRIIRPGENNRPYAPFAYGIEPYLSEINRMPQGFERYERYLAHERIAKAKALVILQHAFPESCLTKLPTLWNDAYLPDKEITLRIDRSGNMAAPGAQQRRLMGLTLAILLLIASSAHAAGISVGGGSSINGVKIPAGFRLSMSHCNAVDSNKVAEYSKTVDFGTLHAPFHTVLPDGCEIDVEKEARHDGSRVQSYGEGLPE